MSGASSSRVGIHEKEISALRVLREIVAGMHLAGPPMRKGGSIEQANTRIAGRDIPNDIGSRIRLSIIHHQNLDPDSAPCV